jgi:hypothetical protein
MPTRRGIEECVRVKCEEEPLQDGRTYCFRVKVNGEEERFYIEVFVTGTALSTEVEGLEQVLLEKGWEEIARRRVTEEFRSTRLDQWDPKLKVRLTIQSSDLDALVMPEVF